MLVLTRKPQQSIQIGDEITVSIVRVKGNTVQLGIKAPKKVTILRHELLARDTGAVEVKPQPSEEKNPECEGSESESSISGRLKLCDDPLDLLTAV